MKLYLLLHVAVTGNALRLFKVIDVKRYQGFTANIYRLNMNTDIYTIHIASIFFFPFSGSDLKHLVPSQDGASFVPGFALPMPCHLLLFSQRNTRTTIQHVK